MDEQKRHPIDEDANNVQQRRHPVTCEAFERLLRFREELIKETKGHIFEDSTEIIRREREKRTEHLMQVFTGEYGKDPYQEDISEEPSYYAL